VAGSRFVRADLHVHTLLAPGEPIPPNLPSPAAAVAAARQQGIAILGITDHNSIANVRVAVSLAGPDLLVLPGIEISTADGHLLGLFSPDNLAGLEDLARDEVLHLRAVTRNGAQRSTRSMADMVQEIHRRDGLAIAAHIDKPDSLLARANPAALNDLLAQPGLAGIEIIQLSNSSLFTDRDTDAVRRQCWVEREKALGQDAPLARIMSSDAHSPDTVGADREMRTLTRLRADDLNFRAVRAALVAHPESRCKLEANLEVQYPRIVSATFQGGFVDGITLDFSPNLNCVIGGRGSGKSTCLAAITGVLAGGLDSDVDARPNMPEYTEVVFVDGLGSTRRAGRRRLGVTYDLDAPTAPLTLGYADLEQNYGGELKDDDPLDPRATHEFLSRFFEHDAFESQDLHLQTMLAENGDTVRRTATATATLKKLRETRQQLDRSLSTATDQKLAEVAELAKVLATEAPMLEALSQAIAALPEAQFPEPPDLEQLADSYGVDLTVQPAAKFVSGPTGLESELDSVGKKLRTAESTTREEVKAWIRPSQAILDHWGRQHAKWESDIEEKRQKLLAAGLTLQVGQLDQIRTQIKSTDLDIRKYEGWEKQHTAALLERHSLLAELRRLRDRRHADRVKKSDALVAAMNEGGPGATVSIKWTREGMRTEFADRLGQLLDMHSPRKQRLADAVSAAELAEIVWAGDVKRLTAIGGEPFFSEPEVALKTLRSYVVLFELETMDIEDRPEIRVRFADERPGPGRPIAQLSLGQLRSVVLGFVLAPPSNSPLVLDQPEEQLDGPFVASTVVQYLYGAKERRQLIVATHNPNLVVLGDAELVVPLEVVDGQAKVVGQGSVDNDTTCEQIVRLLEGGRTAFERRARRYGLKVERLA
jgi:energy-coupling factor transporter ATP-binding protein EcfA2